MAKQEKKEQIEADLPPEVLEKIEKAAQEKAFADLCKQLGTTPEAVKAMEEQKKKAQELVEYDVTPIRVRINGEYQPSKGICTREKADMIISMAAKYRNRILEEKLGRTYELHMLRDGTFQSKLVGTQNVYGEAVTK